MSKLETEDVERAREQTDESLGAEREKTDDLIEGTVESAKAALLEWRQSSDEAIGLARHEDDKAHRNSPGDSEKLMLAIGDERRTTDETLSAERAHVDETLRAERDELTKLAGAAVDEGRALTDQRLSDERDEADVEIARIEEPLRLLVEHVKDYAIFMLNPAGRVISWNTGAERLEGYRAEEIVGKHVSIFYTPDDVKAGKPREALRTAEREGSVEEEGWRVRKDGTKFMANVVVTALRDPDGKLRGFGKVTRDVTRRFTSAERALQRSEETLRLATEGAGLGTWDWKRATGELECSESCTRMLGLDPSATPSFESFLAVVHPEDRRHIEEAVARVLDPSSSDDCVIELRVPRPDGSIRWFAARGKMNFEGEGAERRASRFTGVVADITDRKDSEREREQLVRELDRAVKARDEFVAVLSHDLRTPISTILLGAGLLAGQFPESMPEPRKRVDIIRRAAERAGRMIEDLLQEITIDRGLIRLAIEPHDASSLVTEACAMFEAGAREHHVAVSTRVPGERAEVSCDHDAVLRVFGNLLGNARKFTPAGGTITIAAEPAADAGDAGDAVRFSVTDTGPGILAKDVSRLFQRGFRGDRRGVGLGLGLAIARGIVKAHGGEIGVDSVPGKGATFWFTLPIAGRGPSRAPAPPGGLHAEE